MSIFWPVLVCFQKFGYMLTRNAVFSKKEVTSDQIVLLRTQFRPISHSRQHSRTSIVDEKRCVFQEGGHLWPNRPSPDAVSPHFSPPDSIQRHQLLTRNAVFFKKEVTSLQIGLIRTQFRPISPLRTACNDII